MADSVALRDGMLIFRGKPIPPSQYPPAAQRAIARVWELVPEMQSTRMACGYVAHELDFDPVVVLGWVVQDQHHRQTLPPSTPEAYDVSMSTLPAYCGGAAVGVTGTVFDIKTRVTHRGKAWATFCLAETDHYVEVAVLPDIFNGPNCVLLEEDLLVTVEGRKWFTEATRINATRVAVS